MTEPFTVHTGELVDTFSTEKSDDKNIVDGEYTNNAVRFSPKDLKNIQKGTVYNVVNQIQMMNVGETRLGLNLGTYVNTDNGVDWIYKGDVYYLNGDLIRSVNTYTYTTTEYNTNVYMKNRSDKTAEVGAIRNTEHKWGEIVFASRPDPVADLAYDEESASLTWTKPVDEGFGVETVDNAERTKKDDKIYVTDYTAKVFDEDGTEIYSTEIDRDMDNDNVQITLPKGLIERDKHYKAVVICTNMLGDSDKSEIYIPTPDVEIVMTPDQPVYRENDTVVYTETVTNTGKAKLTEIIVTQDKQGTYDEQDGLTVVEGTSAQIPDLEPGDSYTFVYKVSASLAEDNILVNTADVATKQKVTDETECSVRIIHPAIKVTKDVDQHEYNIGDTVVWTDTITNTGDYPLTNIVVKESLKGEFITETEYKETNDNAIIIPKLEPGESVTINYKTVIDEENIKNNLFECSVTVTAAENVSDSDSKGVPIAAEEDTSKKDTEEDTSKKDTEEDTSKKDTEEDTSKKDTEEDTSTKDTEEDTSKKDTEEDTSKKDTEEDTSKKDTEEDTSKKDTEEDTSKKDTEPETDKETDDKPVKKMMGDVNMDGKVTARDSLMVQRYAIRLERFNDLQIFLADVTGDHMATGADALNILRFAVKLATKTNTGELVDIPKELKVFIN